MSEAESLTTYFEFPRYRVITFLLWDMDMTVQPVCRATLSAVRCLIPVSSEKIEGSGISCVFAYSILPASQLRIIPPSILASSYR